jgi:uncharacterized metal-binding protein YceD (DUF177 family)
MTEPWKVAVRDIPAGGLRLRSEANAAQLAALASELDIPAVERVQLDIRITSRSGGRYVLEGTLSADVVQSCVVTLEPLAGHIACPLVIELRPAETIAEDEEIEAGESLLDEPDIEPIENGMIDLERIVYEELVSRLDPYPRQPGVSLERTEAGSPDAAEHPFARLAALKDRTGPG